MWPRGLAPVSLAKAYKTKGPASTVWHPEVGDGQPVP